MVQSSTLPATQVPLFLSRMRQLGPSPSWHRRIHEQGILVSKKCATVGVRCESMLLLPVRQLVHLPDLAREVDVDGMSMSKKHATVGGNCGHATKLCRRYEEWQDEHALCERGAPVPATRDVELRQAGRAMLSLLLEFVSSRSLNSLPTATDPQVHVCIIPLAPAPCQ